MKMQGAFLITVLAAAFALAQDQSINPSATATTTLEKPKPKLLDRIFLPKPKDEGKIERVDGQSSQAWATIVGWNPARSSFSDPADHEAKLYLFWAGADPQPYQK